MDRKDQIGKETTMSDGIEIKRRKKMRKKADVTRRETAGEKLDREFLVACQTLPHLPDSKSLNWSPFSRAVRLMLDEGLNVDRLMRDLEYREEKKAYLLSMLLTPRL
jgi:hypothetical protein